MITEPNDERLAAPAQDHVTVDDLERLTHQLAAGPADPKLERWHGAPALSTPHSRRAARVSVARRRSTTAGLADDLATRLRRRDADPVDIRVQAQKVCYPMEPRPCMHNAVGPAASTNNGLQDDADLGEELIVRHHLARRDLQLARETISASVSRATSAGLSAPELEGLPQPRATHDAEKGLAATRRWHTLTRAQGKPRSAGPHR